MKFQKKAQGFILKKTLIKETWAFFDIFTKEFWRKSFFIYNIKKSKTIKPAYLWLWNEVEFNFSIKKKIPIISELKLLNSFNSCDLNSLKTLSYFLELMFYLTAQEASNYNLYWLWQSVFKLIKSEADSQKIILFFEIRILSILWFLPDLDFFIDTNKKIILKWDIIFDIFSWWFISQKWDCNDIVYLKPDLVKVVNFYKTWELSKIFLIKLNLDDFLKIKNLFKTIIKTHCPINFKSLSC